MKLSDTIKILQRRQKRVQDILSDWSSGPTQGYRAYAAENAALLEAIKRLGIEYSKFLETHVHEVKDGDTKNTLSLTVR